MELDNDTYVYGVINNKHIRISRENWMDVWSWKEWGSRGKLKTAYWFKIKLTHYKDKAGYERYVITVNKRTYILSRIIYKLYNEDWDITDTSQENLIDHINNNSLDNRIENLRILSNAQNQMNRKSVRGTKFLRDRNLYKARLQVYGISHCGVPRETEEEAHQDYLLLKAKHHILPTSQEGSNHTQITT